MTDVVKLTRSSTRIPEGGSVSDGIPLFPKPKLQIGISRAPQEASELHSHDFTEITVIESGSGSHRYEGADCIVQSGDVFVIQPNQVHQYTDTRQLVVSNVLFYPDGSIPLLEDLTRHPAYRSMFLLEPTLRLSSNTDGRLHLLSDKLNDIILLITRMENALHSPDETSASIATVCLLQLIKDLCDAYSASSAITSISLMKLSKAITHIENHFYDPISIGELAKLSSMSLRSFQRHFLRATGMSAARYIMHHRISEARRLLKAGKNVTETAFEVGFTDSNHFSQIFRKVAGITPKKYQLQSKTS